jgi:hypothetical protein
MITVHAGDHLWAKFDSPAEFNTLTATFTHQALARDACVTVFPGQSGEESVPQWTEAFRRRWPELGLPLDDGRIRVADSRRVQLQPGRFDRGHLQRTYAAAARAAVAEGFTGLWVSVDMSWARDVDPAALTAFEADAHPLFADGRLTALCQYDTGIFPPGQIAAAGRAHPCDAHSPTALRRLHDCAALRLTGETDLHNRAAFAALVESLGPDDHIDISAMTFLDVAALTQLAHAVQRFPRLHVIATPRQRHLLELINGAE